MVSLVVCPTSGEDSGFGSLPGSSPWGTSDLSSDGALVTVAVAALLPDDDDDDEDEDDDEEAEGFGFSVVTSSSSIVVFASFSARVVFDGASSSSAGLQVIPAKFTTNTKATM